MRQRCRLRDWCYLLEDRQGNQFEEHHFILTVSLPKRAGAALGDCQAVAFVFVRKEGSMASWHLR